MIMWTVKELKSLDRKTRKLLTIHGVFHQRSDIDRSYVPRKRGGRGLIVVKIALQQRKITSHSI